MIPETFERLQNSERAVSPVIGVILMVAITVILAAVIAAFVLGFGADTDAPPQASISMDVDDDYNLTIEHISGEAIDADYLRLGGAVNDDDLSGVFDDGNVSTDGEFSGGDIVVIELENEPEGTVNLVWDSGDESTTLASTEV